MIKKSLAALKVGESGKIKKISCEPKMTRRLNDLGFVLGTKIFCLHISPLGDPVAFGVRGAVIALREEDFKNIIIE